MKHGILYIIIPLLLGIEIFTSCSTTSRLTSDEILYTGLKGVKYDLDSGQMKVPASVEDQVTEAVAVKPNNPLFGSASVRSPFPIGLWVYNHWNPNSKGIKGWLYRKLVSEPVLISEVRPEVRTKMIEQIMQNNGYFRASASYELAQKKNKKKASILYDVDPGPVWRIDSLIYFPDTTELYHAIDSVARRLPYLQVGSRYCVDSLTIARSEISNSLRNKGYYFFTRDFIEYMVDTISSPGKMTVKLDIARNIPYQALQTYRVGKVTTTIYRNQGGGEPDTLNTRRGKVICYKPARMRKNLIPPCIRLRSGRLFTVRAMDQTNMRLNRLGVFQGIDMNVLPDTTDPAARLLNVNIDCTFARPLEASAEVNVSSKSNSYLGPGLTLGVTSNNIFGGGEKFTISATGAYEWQTGSGHGKSSVLNSYEFGLNTTLAFPRLLAPNFIPRSRRDVNWTRLNLGADILNRPHYFKMAQFNLGIDYDWLPSKYISTTLTAFKLTYTKLMHTTETFDSIMNANQAIAQSFRNTFIPQMAYTLTYDRAMDRNNNINVQLTAQEGGNIFWAIYEACGKKGEKKLFGTPFSQFVKATAQIVYGRRIGEGDMWLYSRLMSGVAHAYGNSSQVPYAEQFYCGGANSVRAFTVRSLGPGSYRPPHGEIDGYFDQTGTFKFEANTELRFPLLGPLHGAVFIDAGNVWLLKEDPDRPGGKLRASTFFKDLALGTGVGLRFDISMLVLRGDLGIGIHAPYDTGKRGYYNMPSFGKSLAFHLAIGYPF